MSSLTDIRRSLAESARSKIQRTLKISPLFDRVARSTRDAAVEAARLDVAVGGELVIEQGTAPESLALLGRGRVRVERLSNDRRVVPLGYRGPGDVLGESILGRAKRHTENVVTMEEAEIVRVPLKTMNELIAADPGLGTAILSLFVARQRETEDRIESMLFRNVEGRLAEFLLSAAERWGVPTPRGNLISAPITHLEIAQSIGSTRETVTLTLGALRREGVLDVAGRRLIIRDREALEAKV